ncbi:hypothetical protein RFI_00084 [Reticulomyxa filosa]|uniref:Uncharacterized protein n=1 Tax=Reticulomyxa filosa TaxID=46433 RepID=X6PFV3_RETFI|nr:hypothetical protein RFI_00084 [Reticulomyxa filosa]|eukprot:ETO36978.1 hypothetical protein RFI_00084 [Reticulomyxa filosa]
MYDSKPSDVVIYISIIISSICLCVTIAFLVQSLSKITLKETSLLILCPALLMMGGYLTSLICMLVSEIWFVASNRRSYSDIVIILLYCAYIVARTSMYMLWVSRIHISFSGTVFDYPLGLKILVFLVAIAGSGLLSAGIILESFLPHVHGRNGRLDKIGGAMLVSYYLGDSCMQMFVLGVFVTKLITIANKMRQRVLSPSNQQRGEMLSTSSLEFINVACKFVNLGLVCITIDFLQTVFKLCFMYTV